MNGVEELSPEIDHAVWRFLNSNPKWKQKDMRERKERAEKLAAKRRESEMAMKAEKRAKHAEQTIPDPILDISCPDYPSWLLERIDRN